MASCNGTYGKSFKPKALRNSLCIPEGPISSDYCIKIAEYMQISFGLYTMEDQCLTLVSQSTIVQEKHINLFLNAGHYFEVTSDVRKIAGIKYDNSIQIQDNAEVCE